MVLLNPVIHLYWAHALATAEEMLKVTQFPMGVCGAQAEREYVTLDSKQITCPSCRERAKARSGSGSGRRDERALTARSLPPGARLRPEGRIRWRRDRRGR